MPCSFRNSNQAWKASSQSAQSRSSIQRRPAEEWLTDPDREIDSTLDYEQACKEAARCMSCGLCFDCEQCWLMCPDSAIGWKGKPVWKERVCKGCMICREVCPAKAIGKERDLHED